jgi:hypothetical protein
MSFEKIDIVYPFLFTKNSIELKYSLRSIEKYIQNLGDVFIISSHIPDWLNEKKINFIYFRDQTKNEIGKYYKNLNVINKLKKFSFQAPEKFLYFNDDFFLLKPFSFEYRARYTLAQMKKEFLMHKINSYYYEMILNTINFLGREDIFSFERHDPFLMTKKGLEKLFENLPDFEILKKNCVFYRTTYAFFNNIEPTKIAKDDIKVFTIADFFRGRRQGMFSSSPAVVWQRWFLNYLNKFFPEKSKFEK